MVELLLANKADVNATDNGGMTPLHLARYNGHKDVVELLLANNADVNAKDKRWRDPFDLWAATGGYKDIMKMLVETEFDVNTKSRRGGVSSLFHVAAFPEVIRAWWNPCALLAKNADVNAKKNEIGKTPFYTRLS